MLPHRLTYEAEEYVGQAAKLDLVRVDLGVVVPLVVANAEKGTERDVGVAYAVVEVTEVFLTLVEAVVGDAGPEDEHETDDTSRDGVRGLAERQRALAVGRDVGAAPINLDDLRKDGDSRGEERLGHDLGQNRAPVSEQDGDEGEWADAELLAVCLGRALRLAHARRARRLALLAVAR